MFTKKPETDQARGSLLTSAPRPATPQPLAPAQAAARPAPMPGKAVPSTIGQDLVIMGNLIAEGGEVVIEGTIQGDINCRHLTVGQTAKVTGGIVADEVVIRGEVMGSIRGNKVMLQSTSKVEGDVYHKALAIEQGAVFEGRSRRAEDPLQSAPKGESPTSKSLNGAGPHLQG